MREFKYTILFSLFIQVCFAQNSLTSKQNSPNDTLSYEKGNLSSDELEYLKVRDRYVKYFLSDVARDAFKEDEDKMFKEEEDSLLDLEKRLRSILKDCRINNISKDGKINLEDLSGQLGFGMLDGLNLNKDSVKIFCTSKSLFFDYFKKEKISQLDNLTSKNIENIFNSVFSDDAYITNFSSGKMPAKNNIQVYGMIGMESQAIGPFLPDYFYVFLADNNFIYMAEKHFMQPVNEIPECKFIWDSIYSESQKADSIYRNSKLNDTVSFNKSIHLEDLAFDKYCNCFRAELKNTSQFEEIQKEINKTVQYIMSNK